jgi:two-component system invasion response regulator UvrY
MKRVLFIDDNEVVRDSLKIMFAAGPGGAVFGDASNAEEAMLSVHGQKWDVAVLDLSRDGPSGIEVLKVLKQTDPGLPVLILNLNTDERCARHDCKVAAEDSQISRLLRVINAGTKGRDFDAVLAELPYTTVDESTGPRVHDVLSNREFQLLGWIGLGKMVSEVADPISLVTKTLGAGK